MKHTNTVVGLSSFLLLISILTAEGIAHDWMAPQKAAEIKNPFMMEDQSIQRGKDIYVQNCATCHGDDMQGRTAAEAGLEMGPPDLKKRISTHSDGDFFWKIQNGRGDMPGFRGDLPENETWDVINYIRDEAK
ncbi:MAG: c-type cytochrome [Desulfobacterales bacterium]|nr:c-type cytochrome [Deltaproteobacteria bacterium]NNK94777.1 c-type cytochrome [Desulfobacterales bacterium]